MLLTKVLVENKYLYAEKVIAEGRMENFPISKSVAGVRETETI